MCSPAARLALFLHSLTLELPCSALHVGTHTHTQAQAHLHMYKRFILAFGTCSLSLSLAALRALVGAFACVKSRCHWLPTRLLCRLYVCVCVCGVHTVYMCVCVCCIYCLFDQLEMISFQIQRAADKWARTCVCVRLRVYMCVCVHDRSLMCTFNPHMDKRAALTQPSPRTHQKRKQKTGSVFSFPSPSPCFCCLG